jgi:hypothetical protein
MTLPVAIHQENTIPVLVLIGIPIMNEVMSQKILYVVIGLFATQVTVLVIPLYVQMP